MTMMIVINQKEFITEVPILPTNIISKVQHYV